MIPAAAAGNDPVTSRGLGTPAPANGKTFELMLRRDFTLSHWGGVCRALQEAGYRCLTVRDYLADTATTSRIAILRHDVDRSPGDAMAMAQTEEALGISATYYFRRTKNVFRPGTIRAIAGLGHEIGYHYETLAITGGDYAQAHALFLDSLEDFRRLVPVDTISMHGRPLSKWDSRWLWKRYSFEDCGVVGEAYLSIDYDEVAYYCDTGRTWDSQRFNIRDHVDGRDRLEVDSTAELIDLIRSEDLHRICISAHPNRWPAGRLGWISSMAADTLVNGVKVILTRLQSP